MVIGVRRIIVRAHDLTDYGVYMTILAEMKSGESVWQNLGSLMPLQVFNITATSIYDLRGGTRETP